MKLMIFLLGCMVMLYGNAEAGERYQWTDASGKIHYGDGSAKNASDDVVEFEVVKTPGAPMAEEDLPYETRRAKDKSPVTLYVADGCDDPCNRGRSLLNKRGIPFTERSLRTKDEVDKFKKLSGSDTAPTLAVGNAYLRGFSAENWNFELDAAGYPKSAPYRPSNPTPPAAASAVPPSYPFKR